MRRHIIPLFAANMVAFASVGISYLLYSRLLTAREFGAYAAALAVGNLAILVLDGGMRTSIIKHSSNLAVADESSLLLMMCAFSLVLIVALYIGQNTIAHFYPAVKHQSIFISEFGAVYLLTYPWIGLATAALERRLEYPKLAWIESTAVVLERGAPAAFLLSTKLGLGSFVLGLALGRMTRVALLCRLHRVTWDWRVRGSAVTLRRLLAEGLAYQVGGAASLVRDNAHIIVVGPLFGALWVGYYAWGFQLCTIASQAFVQISARVSLPITARALEFSDRWPTVTTQVAVLTAATAPILSLVLVLSPALNHLLFNDKWVSALPMLPLFCARMVPGIACTPVGTLLLVQNGAARYATALWLWTVIELAGAYLAVAALGPEGMAVSYAVTAWAGLFLLVKSLSGSSNLLFIEICVILARRPALWVFVVVGAVYAASGFSSRSGIPSGIAAGCALLSLSTLVIDPVVRSVIRSR